MKIKFIILFLISSQFIFAQQDSLEINTLDTNSYHTGFIIQAHIAPFLTTNLYTKTIIDDYSNPINPNSLNKEHPTYLTGVNFGYNDKDWLVLTGLHFTNRSSDYHLEENSEIISGDDTSIVTTVVDYTNKYQDLHIPLSFGYITYFNKWILAVKAGIYFSINLKNDGYTYDFKEKKLILLNENLSTFLVSYTIDASLKYQFGEKTAVFFNPFYISGINSMWKESPVYAWKQIHYGLSIGLEYHIN